jgi:16S rRNA (cytosine967-C5)-methyltransferase
MSAARTAALHVLRRVAAGATLADALVRERDRLPDARDRGLATQIATGTLRWRGALDAAIAAASGRPLIKIDPAVLDILRLSSYQLLHLERTPARAVVHDAVDITRREGHASAAGFVNAVLRRVAAAKKPPARPKLRSKADRHSLASEAAAAGSHPPWLVERWLDRWGLEATERWMAFNNEPASLTLRVNRLKTTPDALRARLETVGVLTTPTEWASHGLKVTSGNPVGGAAAAEGLFVVQDEASQLVGELAAAWRGRSALDACAAPGGKTLALVEAAGSAGLVVAADRRPRRMRLLRDTMRRLVPQHVPLVQLDLSGPVPFRQAFDLVLVDAPCSGLGTLRREPDLKWRRQPEDLVTFSEIQQRLLAHAAEAVAPGGRLIYATCSSEPEENDAVVADFLDSHPGFRLTPSDGRYPPGLAIVLDADGVLRTSPVRHGLEAFFASVLSRA